MKKTPKLRFPDFSEDWMSQRLGEVSEIVMGQSPSSECYNEEHLGLPLIQGNADIKNKKTCPRIYTSQITKTCDVGDIIMSVRAPVGEVSRSIHHACIGRGVCAIKPKENSEFIYQVLLQQESKWGQIAQGSTFESVNRNDIYSMQFSNPSAREQEKIASFFLLIDGKIERQKKKVEALQQYKKGLMQKIFSQEMRFKDENGKEYPEWEETGLEQYIVEYTEKTTENNQYPVLTSSRNGIVLQTDYFKDRQVTTEDNIGYHVIPYGYITFRSRSDDGNFTFNQNKIIDKGIVSYFYPVFTFNGEVDSFYALTYMNNFLSKQIIKEIVGTSQLVLSINKLKKLTIKLPCIVEQQKISGVLSTIERKTEKEQEKLEGLKAWKKGLLQQMFV